ncbi:hypothetical protein [Streptomyces sp. cg35]|uniref:hypothetical protein n=1 Tax=Streptomyces sp. cg35 TaxID=3421650 RepID=UPI003D180827
MSCDPNDAQYAATIRHEGAMTAQRARELIGEHVQGVTLTGNGIAGRLLGVRDDEQIWIGNGLYQRKTVRLSGHYWLWHTEGPWAAAKGLPLGTNRVRR